MDQKTPKTFNRTDHLANERTFLAWIRTSLGIMAFGFVVEKFAFFLRQISALLGKQGLTETVSPPSALLSYSSVFGIFLVAIGAIMCLLAFIKFKSIEKQINSDTYYPSLFLDILLTGLVFFVGVFLVVYLIITT